MHSDKIQYTRYSEANKTHHKTIWRQRYNLLELVLGVLASGKYGTFFF